MPKIDTLSFWNKADVIEFWIRLVKHVIYQIIHSTCLLKVVDSFSNLGVLIVIDCLPYARHYNPLLIRNRSWILTIHKAKGHSTRMNLKNWVKSIQTAGYNGVRPVYATPIFAYFWTSWRISIGCHNKRRHSLIFSNAASVYLMGFCKKLKCHKVLYHCTGGIYLINTIEYW